MYKHGKKNPRMLLFSPLPTFPQIKIKEKNHEKPRFNLFHQREKGS
jgi:hypothetical protein